MDIFSFFKWWWERYFDHIKETELIAAKNWRELCLTKIKEMDKRLMDNGITVIFFCLLLTGCVTMRYQDGNKSVEYMSVGRTAQTIQGDLNQGTVKVEGQKIDARIITAITDFLRAVQ